MGKYEHKFGDKEVGLTINLRKEKITTNAEELNNQAIEYVDEYVSL